MLLPLGPFALRGCERISRVRRDVFRVPLALPVFVTRRGQAIQHWQSQWHTALPERDGQSEFLIRKSLIDRKLN